MNFPAITPAAPVAAVQPGMGSGNATSVFQAALRDVGQALYTDPSAVGRAMLSGIDGFKLRESHLQDALRQATASDAVASPAASMLGAAPSSVSSVAPPAAAASPQSDGSALRDSSIKAVGVMMETYDFALQTGLVTNAATTFTSSINTLIKTQ